MSASLSGWRAHRSQGREPAHPAGFTALFGAAFRKQRQAVADLLASDAEPGAMSADIHD